MHRRRLPKNSRKGSRPKAKTNLRCSGRLTLRTEWTATNAVAIRLFVTEGKAMAYLEEALAECLEVDVSGMNAERLEACLNAVAEEQGYRFRVYSESVCS